MNEKKLIRELAKLPEARMPNDFSQKIMSRIAKEEKSALQKIVPMFYPALAAGLALVVCLAVFNFKARVDRDDSAIFFEKGVALISQDKFEASLPFFEKAASLDSDNAETFFFLGVNHGRLGHFQEEQAAYLSAIELNPDHLKAHYFLGHSYMSQEKWGKAASEYDNVLKIDPGFENAFFNKGLALKKSGRTKEAVTAWKNYLDVKKTGVWALRAVAHLNAHGDFSYRPFRMGKQKIIMGPFRKDKPEPAISLPDESLRRLGKSLKASTDMDLFVMVYMKKNPETARLKALRIKNKLLEHYPEIRPDRIKISWFGQEDNVSAGYASFSLEQSIRFLGVKSDILEKGVNS